jgi:cyclin-dependent kinase-like
MNKYRVLELIGEGSYGVVLKCINSQSGSHVAIKRFKHTEDPIIHRNTLRELKMLKALRHPNIVKLLEAFRRKKKLVMVFEYMDGNLLELLQQTKQGLPREQVHQLSFQLLLGLHWCHAHGILHRDIKPENLLVSTKGALKVRAVLPKLVLLSYQPSLTRCPV